MKLLSVGAGEETSGAFTTSANDVIAEAILSAFVTDGRPIASESTVRAAKGPLSSEGGAFRLVTARTETGNFEADVVMDTAI